MSEQGWIGCDLDGTLAHYENWTSHDNIGAPIKPMVDRVKRWLAEGRKVKIFTARIHDEPLAVAHVEQWCLEHIGVILPVTNVKDHHMVELYDDRCVKVIQNTGELVGSSSRGL